jgi:hypothetical protein
MNRADYINGLRNLADWLEQNPSVPVPEYADRILVPLMTNADVEQVAEAASLTVECDKDGNAAATFDLGPIEYRLYGYADWDTWRVKHAENTARDWAAKNGMTIQPAGDVVAGGTA